MRLKKGLCYIVRSLRFLCLTLLKSYCCRNRHTAHAGPQTNCQDFAQNSKLFLCADLPPINSLLKHYFFIRFGITENLQIPYGEIIKESEWLPRPFKVNLVSFNQYLHSSPIVGWKMKTPFLMYGTQNSKLFLCADLPPINLLLKDYFFLSFCKNETNFCASNKIWNHWKPSDSRRWNHTGYSFWDRLRNFLHKFTWIVLSVHKLNKLDKFW